MELSHYDLSLSIYNTSKSDKVCCIKVSTNMVKNFPDNFIPVLLDDKLYFEKRTTGKAYSLNSNNAVNIQQQEFVNVLVNFEGAYHVHHDDILDEYYIRRSEGVFTRKRPERKMPKPNYKKHSCPTASVAPVILETAKHTPSISLCDNKCGGIESKLMDILMDMINTEMWDNAKQIIDVLKTLKEN